METSHATAGLRSTTVYILLTGNPGKSMIEPAGLRARKVTGVKFKVARLENPESCCSEVAKWIS